MTVGTPLKFRPKFNIIKSRSGVDVAETSNGNRVRRSEKIFFPEAGRSIACAPYDNHFVFVDNSNLGWTTFCTCGSPAVIVGYQVYKNDGSPTKKEFDTIAGEMLICYHHASFGKHLTGDA